jgi:ribosome-binding factor A
MATFRIEKINKELLRVINEILHKEVKNETAQEAILTEVNCSKDLGHAKVYFITLDPNRREVVLGALDNVAGQIRGHLGKIMRLRVIPELHFAIDLTEEKARQLDRLLDSLHAGQEEPS